MVVYVFTVGLGSGVAFVAAYFFDITVYMALNSAAYALDFISQGWTAARDLANMAFILILVYIAYTILLNSETTGTMKMLAWVIFIALIVNFSFFLTRLVIDGGNILAVQFYNAIPGESMENFFGQGAAGSAATTAASTAISYTGGNSSSLANTKDITSNIMKGLNLQGAFSSGAFQKFQTDSGFFTSFLILSFLYITLGLFFFLLAMLLITAGIKFLFRVVILWFVIIASPLALVARAMPGKMNGLYKQWQDMLIKNTFYPAVFLFIFIFISNFMGQLGPGGVVGSIFGDLAQLSSNPNIGGMGFLAASVGAIAIRMGLLIALLYVAITVSDMVSSYGASAAHNVTGWVSRKGTGMMFGGMGVLGRNTFGWAGSRLAQSEPARHLAAQKGGRGLIGSGLMRTGEFLGKRTFDARGVSLARAGLGKIGIEAKEPVWGKGGYAESFKKRVEKKTAFAEKLGPDDMQMENARKKALGELVPEEKQYLQDAADKYNKELERKNAGADNRREVTETLNAYRFAMKTIKTPSGKNIMDRSKEIAGSNYNKEYAKAIESRSARNAWGITSALGFISKADHEAARRIRGNKKDEESKHISQLLKDMGVKPHEDDEPTPPVGGGGGGGGGAAGGAGAGGGGLVGGAPPAGAGAPPGGGGARGPMGSFHPPAWTLAPEPTVNLSSQSIKAVVRGITKATSDNTEKTVTRLDKVIGRVETTQHQAAQPANTPKPLAPVTPKTPNENLPPEIKADNDNNPSKENTEEAA